MINNPTILLVDDTETNIDILVELLSDKYDILVTLDGQGALDILNEDTVDLILLDIMMPVMNGYEVCRKLKANEKTKNIPVIFITAKTDEDSIEKAYDEGGIDYVTKPFRPRELLARVKTVIKLQQLISNLEQTQKELKLLASTDPMTNLYNRRYFSKVSEHILDLAKRDKTSLCVIMLDIDKFKNINDTYGHKVGDEVIIDLANRLNDKTRNSDIVCRFGGEEFVILLPDTTINGAFIIAEKIREEVENYEIDLEYGRYLKYTISIGVSEVIHDEDVNIEATIHRADEALYKAKNSGRNKTICN